MSETLSSDSIGGGQTGDCGGSSRSLRIAPMVAIPLVKPDWAAVLLPNAIAEKGLQQ
ncbi:hypothetical protein [Rosistilla oblonga]|uniref:hypothetical protein n=1 Tax=Rosistilla oblonga TaxID=2527990 RepID=UPI0018D23827|nr:hypothetical protein [Rosistilla oblonga]